MLARKNTYTDHPTEPYGNNGIRRASHTQPSQKNDEGDDFLAALCYNDEGESDQPHDKHTGNRKPNIWIAFMHLLLAPRAGWKRIKGTHFDKDETARSLFYPLLALMAAGCFIDKLYYADPPGISTLLQRAVAAFIAGFAGYFLIGLLARMFLPTAARNKIQSTFGHIYIMVILSALALCVVIAEVFPWLGLLLLVPPTYVAYLAVKGVKYLRIPTEETTPAAILMTVLCLGVPTGIYYLLQIMMPQA